MLCVNFLILINALWLCNNSFGVGEETLKYLGLLLNGSGENRDKNKRGQLSHLTNLNKGYPAIFGTILATFLCLKLCQN